MSLLAIALAVTINGQAPIQPRAFEKTRSDGATVVCVRHDKKPTIFTPRVECKPASHWRVARQEGVQVNSPGGTYTTEFAFSSPRATPRLIGK